MRWLIRVLIIISIFVYSNLDSSYMDKPYVPEYPCVIMEAPHVKYVLLKSGGKIIAIYKEESK